VEEEKAKNEDVNVQGYLEQLAQHGLGSVISKKAVNSLRPSGNQIKGGKRMPQSRWETGGSCLSIMYL